MNCISFNCRGAGNNPTVRELAHISRIWSPRLLFLCETRQSVSKMRRLRHRLGLKGFAGFSSTGLSKGVARPQATRAVAWGVEKPAAYILESGLGRSPDRPS
jgi:hypothetical protein